MYLIIPINYRFLTQVMSNLQEVSLCLVYVKDCTNPPYVNRMRDYGLLNGFINCRLFGAEFVAM
jgi:hypothetical protein